MLEALLCAAGVALGKPHAIPQPAANIAPDPEMLEFLANWRDDEARQFLDPHPRGDIPLPTLGGTGRPTKDHGHER